MKNKLIFNNEGGTINFNLYLTINNGVPQVIPPKKKSWIIEFLGLLSAGLGLGKVISGL